VNFVSEFHEALIFDLLTSKVKRKLYWKLTVTFELPVHICDFLFVSCKPVRKRRAMHSAAGHGRAA